MDIFCVSWDVTKPTLLTGGDIAHSRGFRCSSAARAVGSRRRSRMSLAQSRAAINAQRDVILSLNIDVALMTEELKCSTYA